MGLHLPFGYSQWTIAQHKNKTKQKEVWVIMGRQVGRYSTSMRNRIALQLSYYPQTKQKEVHKLVSGGETNRIWTCIWTRLRSSCTALPVELLFLPKNQQIKESQYDLGRQVGVEPTSATAVFRKLLSTKTKQKEVQNLVSSGGMGWNWTNIHFLLSKCLTVRRPHHETRI